MIAVIKRLALLSVVLTAGCGTPEAGPQADIRHRADNSITLHWPGADPRPIQLYSDDAIEADDGPYRLRQALMSWIKTKPRLDDTSGASAAVIRFAADPAVDWTQFLHVAQIAAHPELRVWQFDAWVVGDTEPTRVIFPRDPGLYDVEALVGDTLLPPLFTSIRLSARTARGGAHALSVTVRSTAEGADDAASTERVFALSLDATAVTYARALDRLVQHVKAEASASSPDAIRLMVARGSRPSMATMLPIYRALRAAVEQPILFLED